MAAGALSVSPARSSPSDIGLTGQVNYGRYISFTHIPVFTQITVVYGAMHTIASDTNMSKDATVSKEARQCCRQAVETALPADLAKLAIGADEMGRLPGKGGPARPREALIRCSLTSLRGGNRARWLSEVVRASRSGLVRGPRDVRL